MDIELARDVLRGAFSSARELQKLLPLLKQRCEPDEYQTYAKAIAAVLAEISLEVVNKVLAAYPALEAEVEASLARSQDYEP
jgi:hypothetical protein